MPADGAGDERVEVVGAHPERATLRVGETFLKVDTDQDNADREVAAMALAPVPTPEVLWHRPPVLALRALDGEPIARLGQPATSTRAAWRAAGSVVRRLHDAPLPPWPDRTGPPTDDGLGEECDWLVAQGLLTRRVVDANRDLAQAALRPAPTVFMHGDLQVAHVFVADDEVTGILDWSEAGRGVAAYDLAVLTLGHRDHLDDVLDGYGRHGVGVDRDTITGWWAFRCLASIRWLVEHGYDVLAPGCEGDVLTTLAASTA